ncbi:thiosulfate:glutathione sulfurtransferase-like isoform X2 [Antennarius striatus]|uniref:thiosulfate:glutathione sulfurtransferase-like isoform X2 n=1 Tax=Antennarius striatus TaxID=241820 RepID=UPI0035AEE2B6
MHSLSLPGTKEISYNDLKKLVGQSQDLFLIDVRSTEEVERSGRIPGSVNIPIDTVDAALAMDPDAFMTKYGSTKPPVDAPELVFHCHMGKRGALATEKARKLGYTNACNYAGAYIEWSAKEGE